MKTDPTQRFSSRVENYIRYRPGYPEGVLRVLETECGLTPDSSIADVGSGTGILAELFLASGHDVVAVEPNDEMRQAGERLLAKYDRLGSVSGRAEETGLDAGSIDIVTAGQAFHWFDAGRARAEFLEILRPGGHVVLIWNERRTDSTPFLAEYEELIRRHGTDYDTVRHENIGDERFRAFFGEQGYRVTILSNHQVFDLEGLEGRLLSSSYVPGRGEPGCEAMLEALGALFAKHQRNGTVTVEYNTRVLHGPMR